jgi:hypothetical protein
MRGMTSSDGKMTGNVQTVGRYDESKKKSFPKPKPEGGESGGVHEEDGHDEIKQVVGEHGAAHKHIITIGQDEGGGHSPEHGAMHVHSETHHADGHIHHADHASLAEAHEHGKVAMEDAEHNPMGEDAMEDAGERGGAEHLSGKKTPSFMD